jgi:flagellar secretion chaperone FliS
MTASNRKKEYVAQRVLSASPVELIYILYQSAVQAVDEAVIALQAGDILERGRAVTKAIEILSELQASLRRDVQEEYTNTLGELYGYMQQQLMRAHREKSETILLEVSRLLNTLLEGWTGAMDTLASTAVSQSTGVSQSPAQNATVFSPYATELTGSSPDRCWQF